MSLEASLFKDRFTHYPKESAANYHPNPFSSNRKTNLKCIQIAFAIVATQYAGRQTRQKRTTSCECMVAWRAHKAGVCGLDRINQSPSETRWLLLVEHTLRGTSGAHPGFCAWMISRNSSLRHISVHGAVFSVNWWQTLIMFINY